MSWKFPGAGSFSERNTRGPGSLASPRRGRKADLVPPIEADLAGPSGEGWEKSEFFDKMLDKHMIVCYFLKRGG